MIRLIVNADDLGLSSAINAGIIKAHVEGIVTSTSVVAAGQAFPEGVLLAQAHPGLGVGIHLTLVEENAAADPERVPTLAPNGVLPRSYGQLVKKVMTGRIKLREIETEFRAQIEKCLLAGIKPTHLDSHQHTHALPLVFPIAVRVAQDYAIPGIRIPRAFPTTKDISANRFLGKCGLCLFAHADAAFFSLKSRKTTGHFAGLFESGSLSKFHLFKILSNLRPGTTELVSHPGCNDSSPRYASWNERRQLELASLVCAGAKELIQQRDVQLISFRDL